MLLVPNSWFLMVTSYFPSNFTSHALVCWWYRLAFWTQFSTISAVFYRPEFFKHCTFRRKNCLQDRPLSGFCKIISDPSPQKRCFCQKQWMDRPKINIHILEWHWRVLQSNLCLDFVLSPTTPCSPPNFASVFSYRRLLTIVLSHASLPLRLWSCCCLCSVDLSPSSLSFEILFIHQDSVQM